MAKQQYVEPKGYFNADMLKALKEAEKKEAAKNNTNQTKKKAK